jgi:hypothetical protein
MKDIEEKAKKAYNALKSVIFIPEDAFVEVFINGYIQGWNDRDKAFLGHLGQSFHMKLNID